MDWCGINSDEDVEWSVNLWAVGTDRRKKNVAISGENKLPSLGTVIIFIIINLMSQIISNKDRLHIFSS